MATNKKHYQMDIQISDKPTKALQGNSTKTYFESNKNKKASAQI